jgi:integrase
MTKKRWRKIGDGRWEYRRSITVDGKTTIVKRRFASAHECEVCDAELTRKVASGGVLRESSITVGEHVAEWLGSAKNLRPSTRHNYRSIVEAYVMPTLGSVQLRKLTTSRLQSWVDELERGGRTGGGKGNSSRRGQPLSPKTVANIHGMLHKALQRAVVWRRLDRNPADHVELPRRRKTERRSATIDELARIVAACDTDRLGAAWRLAWMLGVRRSELRALTWRDIDLDTGLVSITKSMVRVGTTDHTDETKTANGMRINAIDPETIALLTRWHEAQRLERMVAGDGWRGGDLDSCLVLTDPDGSAVTPSAIRRRHDALLRAAGVPRYLMHEARHTVVVQRSKYETMHGVSRMVGHASATYTVDQYWHAHTGHDRPSAHALADELRRRRES